MPKADRVHSTPSTNTPTSQSHPVDATSRRRFLTNSKKIVGTVNVIAAEITGRLKSTSRSRLEKPPYRPRKARRSQEAANHPAGNGISGQAD